MIVAELVFKIIRDTDFTNAEQGIRRYVEALIFNGQILGREFPTAWQDDRFSTRVVMSDDEALRHSSHSPRGLAALQQLADVGLSYPQLAVLGQDLLSSHVDPCVLKEPDQFAPHQSAAGCGPTTPASKPLPTVPGYIWYSRFALTHSMLCCAEHFAPVPLYRLPVPRLTTTDLSAPSDHEDAIRWQLQFQALDEIQMQQTRVLPLQAERQLQGVHSALNRQGRRLAKAYATTLQQPVYYYLYAGSSRDCATEADKRCPSCQQPWRLATPWHDMFDFRCDRCFLVSNIAWECQ
jgi:predicted  nucleic acid-binding Zn ribbon protein